MGKVKRSKNKPHKENPTGLPSVKYTLEEESEEPGCLPQENTVQNILEQLQSANVEEKYCGLQTFALFIEDPNRIDEVTEVIRVAAPLMLDSSSCVRNAASGALRNFSILGPQVCEMMIEEDIMTPLIASFHEHADKWVPKENNKNKYDEDGDTVIQTMNLLWNLCEYSATAIKHLNESRVLEILVKFMDRTVFGDDVTIASLQCLFVVTEDNKHAVSNINSICEEILQKILIVDSSDPSILLQKVLAAGIVLNFSNGDVASLPPNTIGLIISILASTLSVDHRMSCNNLSNIIPLELKCSVTSPKVKKSKDQLQLENQLKSVQYLLEAQQTSVEIVANICSLEGSDDDYMDTNNESDTEESIDGDNLSDCSKGGIPMSIEDKLPPEVTEGIVSHQIFNKVWGKTILPAENTLQILKQSDEGKNIFKKICNLRSRSLLCINNMMSSLQIDIIGGINEVCKIWIETGKMVFKAETNNDDLLESATSVMRAAIDKIKENIAENPHSHNDLINSLAPSDVELMLNGIRQCELPTTRANLIRMVGILALLFVDKTEEAVLANAVTITNFILDHSHKEQEAWVLAEAIDVIMDLYSEDETNALALKVDLVSKMNALLPVLKNKVRQQKKSLGEHSLIVNTALTNLPRFIKYKKRNISK